MTAFILQTGLRHENLTNFNGFNAVDVTFTRMGTDSFNSTASNFRKEALKKLNGLQTNYLDL